MSRYEYYTNTGGMSPRGIPYLSWLPLAGEAGTALTFIEVGLGGDPLASVALY